MPRRQYLIMVKGTDALATEEAQRRGCTVVHTMPRNSDYATLVVSAPTDGPIPNWFLSGNQADFPEGELMYYKEIENVVEAKVG